MLLAPEILVEGALGGIRPKYVLDDSAARLQSFFISMYPVFYSAHPKRFALIFEGRKLRGQRTWLG
jgi:hypothetical protein